MKIETVATLGPAYPTKLMKMRDGTKLPVVVMPLKDATIDHEAMDGLVGWKRGWSRDFFWDDQNAVRAALTIATVGRRLNCSVLVLLADSEGREQELAVSAAVLDAIQLHPMIGLAVAMQGRLTWNADITDGHDLADYIGRVVGVKLTIHGDAQPDLFEQKEEGGDE